MTTTQKPDADLIALTQDAARARVAVLRRTPGSTRDIERAAAGKSLRGEDTDILAIMERAGVAEDRWEALVDVLSAAYRAAAQEEAQ